VPSIPSWIPGTAAGNSGPLATPVTVADFPRIVARGKSGHDVILLQKRLNDLGFTVATRGAGSPGKETSYFGPKTQAALVRFQKAHNLPATGKLDPQTVEVLVGSS
jgi:peptidoglycan hydrolase-like protein with peptidoglycan-binding domain